MRACAAASAAAVAVSAPYSSVAFATVVAVVPPSHCYSFLLLLPSSVFSPGGTVPIVSVSAASAPTSTVSAPFCCCCLCRLPAAFPEVKSNACKRSLSSFSFELIFSLAKQKIALFKLNGRQFVVLLLSLLLNLSLQRCVSLYVCVCLCESKMKSISFFQNVFHSSQFVVVVVVVGRVKGVLSISGENSNSNNNNDE